MKKTKSLSNHLDIKAAREKNKKQKQMWLSCQLQAISFFPHGEKKKKKNSTNFTSLPLPLSTRKPLKGKENKRRRTNAFIVDLRETGIPPPSITRIPVLPVVNHNIKPACKNIIKGS